MTDTCGTCGRNVIYNRCDECTKRVEEWGRTRPAPPPMKLTIITPIEERRDGDNRSTE